jgi:hypothetical protein
MLLADGRVPYEVAMNFTEAERMAHLIIKGQHKGGRWDWDEMDWSELPKASGCGFG